jgi:hypothetical protein
MINILKFNVAIGLLQYKPPFSLLEFTGLKRKNPCNNTEIPKGAIQSCLGKFVFSHRIFQLPTEKSVSSNEQIKTEKSVSLAFASESQVALHGLFHEFFLQ